MDTPEYVTKEEVQRVCEQLGIRDWTKLSQPEVETGEAEMIQKLVGGEALEISVQEFRQGLEVELEHGIGFDDANVTNNHPILTGKIVLAHLKDKTGEQIPEAAGGKISVEPAGKGADETGVKCKQHLVTPVPVICSALSITLC
jgi:hypothetical protein